MRKSSQPIVRHKSRMSEGRLNDIRKHSILMVMCMPVLVPKHNKHNTSNNSSNGSIKSIGSRVTSIETETETEARVMMKMLSVAHVRYCGA